MSEPEKNQREADTIRDSPPVPTGAAVVTNITPNHIMVQVGGRTVKVGGEALILRPEAPYFVFSEAIRAWQPPHEHEVFSAEDRDDVLRAVRDYMEKHNISYVVDPTDEQYRSL
jgi:hypothetical protein